MPRARRHLSQANQQQLHLQMRQNQAQQLQQAQAQYNQQMMQMMQQQGQQGPGRPGFPPGMLMGQQPLTAQQSQALHDDNRGDH